MLALVLLLTLAARVLVAVADKVDEPIPLVNVTSVEGYDIHLPCDLSPQTPNEELNMVLWYRSDVKSTPVYWVDWRNSLEQGKHWSNPDIFGKRAKISFKKSETRRPMKAELRIEQLLAKDAGLYNCRIDLRDNPTRNQRVNLTVVVPPRKPVIYTNITTRMLAKNPQLFDQDGPLLLECEVSGGSPLPRVVWLLNGSIIDKTFFHKDDVTINRLDLTVAERKFYGAQLKCEASNTHLITRKMTAEVEIDLNLKPLVVNITNKTPYVTTMKTYEIECNTWGSKPNAVITWYKHGHVVVHMARNYEGTNMTRSVMSYVPTMEDNGKNLTCRAENPSILGSALEDNWHLIVHYAPVVTIKLGSTLLASDIDEGDDVYFDCEVQANPNATRLLWFKDGVELRPSSNIIMPGSYSLILQKVTRASAGEYSCMAINDVGRATSRPNVTLEVMYSPVCKDGTTTQVVGALKHETISLVCGVQSKPPPTSFQWTFNNSGELMNVPVSGYAQIKPQHVVTNHWHGSRLNYTPVSDADYGTIACKATNKIGEQKVPCLFQIIVAGKPYPLQNCTALQSTGPYAYRMGHEDFKATDARDADWLIVRCNESFDGGLPITSFEIEVYSDENVYHVNTIYINHTDKASGLGVGGLGGGSGGGSVASNSIVSSGGGSSSTFGPIFEVPGLEPGRNYRLLLYAVNAKGRSDPVVLESVTLKGVAMYTTGRDSSDDTTDYSLLVACFAGGVTAICILVVGVTLTLYRRNHPSHLSKTQTHLVHCPSPSPGSAMDAHNSIVATDDRQQQPHHQLISMQMTQHTGLQQARQEYELLQRRADILKDPARHPLDVFARAHTPLAMTTSTTAASSTSPNPRGGFDQTAEDDPDVIPSTKAERRPDIYEPNYALKPERIKDFRRHLQDEDLNYHSTLTASTSQQMHPQEKDSWLRQNGSCQVVAASPAGSAGSPTSRPSTLPVNRSQDIYTRSLKVQESCI